MFTTIKWDLFVGYRSGSVFANKSMWFTTLIKERIRTTLSELLAVAMVAMSSLQWAPVTAVAALSGHCLGTQLGFRGFLTHGFLKTAAPVWYSGNNEERLFIIKLSGFYDRCFLSLMKFYILSSVIPVAMGITLVNITHWWSLIWQKFQKAISWPSGNVSCILYQDRFPELSSMASKRIMKRQYLSFKLKLKSLIYG